MISLSKLEGKEKKLNFECLFQTIHLSVFKSKSKEHDLVSFHISNLNYKEKLLYIYILKLYPSLFWRVFKFLLSIRKVYRIIYGKKNSLEISSKKMESHFLCTRKKTVNQHVN